MSTTRGQPSAPFKQALLVRSTNKRPLSISNISVPDQSISVSTQAVTKVYVRYLLEFSEISEDLNGKLISLNVNQNNKTEAITIPISTQ